VLVDVRVVEQLAHWLGEKFELGYGQADKIFPLARLVRNVAAVGGIEKGAGGVIRLVDGGDISRTALDENFLVLRLSHANSSTKDEALTDDTAFPKLYDTLCSPVGVMPVKVSVQHSCFLFVLALCSLLTPRSAAVAGGHDCHHAGADEAGTSGGQGQEARRPPRPGRQRPRNGARPRCSFAPPPSACS
jgi:hypothetical protein